ncbi:MAG TPA: antitoxin [Opitutae bacterium]|nr:antitoxin [Puniceicoccaceae bacterium]HBR92935.1 antitoxin [Opitutae bacterium]|tara:strand:- start:112 stop:297 length:186 start_codon:yes stop_codon:yes gene_type:complete
MEIAKSYITDEKGSVKSVVIDYEVFKRIEEALLDQGLVEAMEEVEDESEISAEEMKKILSE